MIKVPACLVLTLLCFYAQGQIMTGESGRGEGSDKMGSEIRKNDVPILEVVFHEGFEKDYLRDTSIQILRRTGQNSYILRGVNLTKNKLYGISEIRTNNIWKLQSGEYLSPPDRWGTYMLKSSSIDILLFLQKFGNAEIIDRSRGLYSLKTQGKYLLEIAGNPQVLFISKESVQPINESRVIDLNLNPNRVNKLHHFFPLLNGSKSTLSIQEDQFDPKDIDLIGRSIISEVSSPEISQHATEMATVIGGAGNSFITGKGVSRAIQLSSSGFNNVLPQPHDYFTESDIHVQNHSYGTSIESFYGLQAEAFDQSAYDNPTLLHVMSSGNQGSLTAQEGHYAGVNGFCNITGNFKMAKNALVVGAVDTTGHRLEFSSRGPAYDGRVKPEIVSYSMYGSSNSAALVSGTASLLQEQFGKLYGYQPTSALIKALFINGADDVGETGPDHITGFGGLNAWKSMQSLISGNFISSAITQDEVRTFDLLIPETATNLKMTLVWTDPPAHPGDAIALINDLDMDLSDPKGTIYHPWVLSTSSDSQALSLPAVRAEDHLNNIEQISLSTPEAGIYKLAIKGEGLLTQSQHFEVVYDWDTLDTFEWDFPTGSDHFPYNGETTTYFRWVSTFGSETGTLEYQMEGESDWRMIEETVALEKGYFRWNSLPDALTGMARARMSIDGVQYETEVFTISRRLNTSVGFNCGDSLMLQWPGQNQAAQYKVSVLGERHLELFAVVTDTFLLLNQQDLTGSQFSIQPISSSGKAFLPSYTFDYTAQGAGCFLSSFYQEVALEEGIYLNLSLSTTYGIERILFERRSDEEFEWVGELINPTTTSIRLLDSRPRQGHNEHRVTLYFQNGQTLSQTANNTYYLTEQPILIFPNPLNNSPFLNVYTRAFDSEPPVFHLYDRGGALILTQRLLSSQESVPIHGIRSGLYFYRIEAGNQSFNGKLIIQ
ncbi:MAG: S8 family peptidase [Marinoscillum sp.]|uniref:S8 family peptidase n=1 Tax=Marinoscillum sp. TaxID=2024838 RepID=UPI0032F3F80A